ncbi:MAG: T9SS type A sorting domain-containing protein [Siphonobacter sp.]
MVKTTVNGCTSESLPFVVTGLEQETEDIKVYPNPSQGIMNIDLPNDKIRSIKIYNIAGIEVYSKILGNKSDKIIAGFLEPGIYTLMAGSVKTKVLIIK